MKNIFLFAIIIAASANALYGQDWSSGSSLLYADPTTTRIGIGLNAPSSATMLHVQATSKDNILRIDVASGSFKSILGLSNGGTTDYGQLYFDNSNNNLVLYQKYGSGDLHLGTNSTTRLTIKNNGNVLINQTTQVNTGYKFDVKGGIRADSVIVNTSGADFVFDDQYDLSSLDEVEQYIKENKHLPGIQSAQEMQKEGVSVGNLQTKLLQKVEELTLYVIKLNKENKELKKRLEGKQ